MQTKVAWIAILISKLEPTLYTSVLGSTGFSLR